jgi:hypothetical protein
MATMHALHRHHRRTIELPHRPIRRDTALVTSRDDRFDLIIIGSGSGNGIPSFFDDRRIALVERDVFGGTCLNRGCIPSKMFVLPADRRCRLGGHS